MALSDFRHRHRLRVRYGECDMQGVVYNARYLDYGDIAITEYWRAVGFRFMGEGAMEFHVANATVDFKKPIKPDEVLDLWTRTEKIGNTSLTVITEIHGARDDGSEDLRSVIREVQVLVDLAEHRPLPLPDAVKEQFRAFDLRQEPVFSGEIY